MFFGLPCLQVKISNPVTKFPLLPSLDSAFVNAEKPSARIPIKLQSNVNQSTSKIIVDVERNLAFEAEHHEGTQAKQQSEGL